MMARPAGPLKDVLKRGPVLAIVAGLTLTSARGADAFRPLNGAEIKARFSGKELTDGVHWSMRFGNGGKLTAFEAVGRFAPEERSSTRGTWRVVRDELCLDHGDGDPTCHQVWMSGKNVQLRRERMPPEDGVLH